MPIPKDTLFPSEALFPGDDDEEIRKGSRGRRMLKYPEEPAPIVAAFDDDEEILIALITGFVKAMK